MEKGDRMELCYIWISNGIFIEQGLNFSKDFEFEVFSDNKKDYYLTVKEKKVLPANFYNKNIINISAIVGKNGAGKTTFIKFLRENLGEGPTINGQAYISIFKDDMKFYISCNFDGRLKKLHYDEKFIELCARYSFKYTSSNGNAPNEYIAYKFEKIVFFANVFDFRNERNNDWDNLIENHSLNSFVLRTLENEEKKIRPFMALRKEEFMKSLDFICDDIMVNNLKEKVSGIPQVISLKLNENRHELYRYGKKKHMVMAEEIANRLEKDSVMNDFEAELSKFFLYTIFEEGEVERESINMCTNSSNYMELCLSFLHEVNPSNKIKYLSFLKCYEMIKNKCEYVAVGHNIFEAYKMRILIKDLTSLKETLQEFNSSIYDSSLSTFMTIHWDEDDGGYSSGQYAIFRLYYSLYNCLKSIRECKDSSSKERTILLVIDELETYMHPEWQRTCVKNLHDFIEILLEDNSSVKVQIIITTNGPFILSDIPSQNINIIEYNDGLRIIRSGLSTKETFAQNIHTLLASSFFMKNGTIGEFSQNKLKILSELLNKPSKEVYECREDIQKYIDLIGEPVIKKLLEQKFHSEIDTYRNQ